ncbi:MAG: DUF1566 domain-containing protein, partial [Verrucomicrobia bacterium]|nr:DUF1566 domain-containing protein [Verrucomicrobiota bacterium]
MRSKTVPVALTALLLAVARTLVFAQTGFGYTLVDTGQSKCYNNSAEMLSPAPGAAFYGQDAQYSGNQPSYKNNGDGTISDLNTGLMWVRACGSKVTLAAATAGASACRVGGYSDWRMPTIKELYSLILFSGTDPSGGTTAATPFIDTSYFEFKYGDTSAGERIIDAQYWSSTRYVGYSTDGKTFGVNFADGRIKGYPGNFAKQFVRYVRGNSNYGVNSFTNNGDGTITDQGTGLMWSRDDSGTGMNWQAALAWAQAKNAANYLGHNDWRLPNAKELQSIVDYTRSLDTTRSAAINPVFNCTAITDEARQTDYPFYWTSTTHANASGGGSFAVYVCFGEALGYMNGVWQDVHGAGAQRSDPKIGSPSSWPYGNGPQGDAVRINNYVRLVRGGASPPTPAQMISPANSSTFTSSTVTFTWNAGLGPTLYALWVGSAPQTYDLYAGIERGRSRTLTLPADGRSVYVTLWSWINGAWQGNDYTYTAATPVKAQMLSPPDGATLTGASTTFIWDAGLGVSRVALWVGNAPQTWDIYAGLETGQSRKLTLPADGRTLHVTLWSLINGSWQSNAYTYTAYAAPAPAKARMLSPADGTTLSGGSATFIWDTGSGVTRYALWVGNTASSHDLYAGWEPGQSRALTLPTDGRRIHVTLWSLINGTWQSNAYSYLSAAGPTPAPAKAQILSPTAGATLSGAATTFIWDTGGGVAGYALWVGSTASSYDLYAGFERGQSRTLTLPT